ncbi:MAG: L-seryl-tRNA(Sec) selenium transferase [Desulfatibacillaceae bacterium]
MSEKIQEKLRVLPAVDQVLHDLGDEMAGIPKSVATKCVRRAVDEERAAVLAAPDTHEINRDAILDRARALVGEELRSNLRRTVNGTGVVIHTNLGRSLLAEEAVQAVMDVSRHYSNLEFDLAKGRRGSRYSAVEPLLVELTGAEAALVVNNNAGAVFLCLKALAEGRKVVVSRGELVEIGGSFRIPDVMAASGARLVEVGTTNRTHPGDYEGAVDEETGMFMKAHTSNFAVVGFTASVSVAELVEIARPRGILVMEDLGSGNLVDLSSRGFMKEPTVQEAVASGADVVTFSGDKMLGGPQAGIIVGKKAAVDRVKKHPLNRALRIDKMTLAAMEATLRLYRDPARAMAAVPTLAMLTASPEALRNRARRLCNRVRRLGRDGITARLVQVSSRVGGGSLPLQELPSHAVAVAIRGLGPNQVELAMRLGDPPVTGRIENDEYLLDVRTLGDDELGEVAAAVDKVAANRALWRYKDEE